MKKTSLVCGALLLGSMLTYASATPYATAPAATSTVPGHGAPQQLASALPHGCRAAADEAGACMDATPGCAASMEAGSDSGPPCGQCKAKMQAANSICNP